MAIFAGLAKLFGGGGNKTPKPGSAAYTANQVQPLIDLQKQIGQYGLDSGKASFEKAGASFDTSLDFYKKIMSGSDDEILKLLNASEYTKSADESQATAYNLGGRSGARAAIVGQTTEDRSATLQRILENIRMQAPNQITDIGSKIANMGAAQLSGGLSGISGASGNIFGVAEQYQKEADRRAALIASLIGAAGSIAGAFAGGSGGSGGG